MDFHYHRHHLPVFFCFPGYFPVRFDMDIQVFLRAQLWLHPVSADAWPAKNASTTAASVADGACGGDNGGNASGDGVGNVTSSADGPKGRVILSSARCCFALPERWHIQSGYFLRCWKGTNHMHVADLRNYTYFHIVLLRIFIPPLGRLRRFATI